MLAVLINIHEHKGAAMDPITLDRPIKRGDTEIAEITLRRPDAGEPRGVVLSDLLRMEATAVSNVLPRITQPSLTAQEVAKMDPADLFQCAVQVTDFLLPKSMKPQAESTPTSAFPDA